MASQAAQMAAIMGVFITTGSRVPQSWHMPEKKQGSNKTKVSRGEVGHEVNCQVTKGPLHYLEEKKSRLHRKKSNLLRIDCARHWPK